MYIYNVHHPTRCRNKKKINHRREISLSPLLNVSIRSPSFPSSYIHLYSPLKHLHYSITPNAHLAAQHIHPMNFHALARSLCFSRHTLLFSPLILSRRHLRQLAERASFRTESGFLRSSNKATAPRRGASARAIVKSELVDEGQKDEHTRANMLMSVCVCERG